MSKYIVNPVLLREIESKKNSIYQTIVAMGFRARDINQDIKKEIMDKMEDIIPTADDNEIANQDQVNISKEFETLPKPHFLAMKEVFDGKMKYEYPQEEE